MRNQMKWLWTSISLAGLLAIYIARCPIYSLGWHAIYGNSSQCGELKIAVPRGWWANCDEKGICVISTWSPTYGFRGQKPVEAAFHAITDAPHPSDKQWQQDVVRRLESEGFVVSGSSVLLVAGKDAFCIESHLPAGPSGHHVMCNIDHAMIVHFSYDDPRWKTDFYQMLRNTS